MNMRLINVADLKDTATGKTYRQLNSEMTHKIPINAVVEVLTYGDTLWSYLAKFFDKHELRVAWKFKRLPCWHDDYGEHTGLRLYVVGHTRDCDQTPLYALSFDRAEKVEEDDNLGRNCVVELDGMRIRGELFVHGAKSNGFAEKSLKLIRLPKEHRNGS